MMPPYDATAEQLQRDIESYVDAVYGSLESQFLVLPQGPSFVEYARFQAAYEVLKKATSGFRALRPAAVWDALLVDSMAVVVLRCILGMSPPEWAELAAADSGVLIPRGYARSRCQSALRRRVLRAPERQKSGNAGAH